MTSACNLLRIDRFDCSVPLLGCDESLKLAEEMGAE